MHHINLDTLHLAKGAHKTPDEGVCLMELVSLFAGEPHTDHPACVSPVLGAFGRSLNDQLDDTKRQQLKPLIPRMVGTAGDGLDETRSYLALDWLIRTYTPTWLDLAGLTDAAAELRALRRIVDLATAQEAGPVVRIQREKAYAAGAAAGAAAWAAAWAAAGAAGDAAWAAAGAAGDAAWAAGDAAWDAAWAAAGDAAGAAGDAGDAAWAALQPTVDQLQDSAITLFTAMIRPAVPA